MDVEELIKRYEQMRKSRKSGVRRNIAEQIRQYVLSKLKKRGDYIELREIVRELLDNGKAEEWFGEGVQYNMVYNRVRQSLTNKRDLPVKFGALEDGTVVVVRVA